MHEAHAATAAAPHTTATAAASQSVRQAGLKTFSIWNSNPVHRLPLTWRGRLFIPPVHTESCICCECRACEWVSYENQRTIYEFTLRGIKSANFDVLTVFLLMMNKFWGFFPLSVCFLLEYTHFLLNLRKINDFGMVNWISRTRLSIDVYLVILVGVMNSFSSHVQWTWRKSIIFVVLITELGLMLSNWLEGDDFFSPCIISLKFFLFISNRKKVDWPDFMWIRVKWDKRRRKGSNNVAIVSAHFAIIFRVVFYFWSQVFLADFSKISKSLSHLFA